MANYIVRMHATVQDHRGAKAAVIGRIDAPDSATLAGLETAAAAWAGKLAAVSVATVMDWGVSAVLNQVPLDPNANFTTGTLAQTAVFDYLQATGPYHGAVAVPAFDSAKLGIDGQPNNADTDVATWINGNTGTVVGGHWAGPGGVDLAAFSYSFYTARKYRKPSRRGE